MFPVASTARLVAGTATTISVGKVISEVIKNNVNTTSTLDRVMVQVGGAALSLVIAGAATAQVEDMVGRVARGIAEKQAARNHASAL